MYQDNENKMIAEGDQQAGKVLSISEFTMNRKEKPYPKHQEAIMNLRQVCETLKSISGPPLSSFSTVAIITISKRPFGRQRWHPVRLGKRLLMASIVHRIKVQCHAILWHCVFKLLENFGFFINCSFKRK